MKRFGMAAMIVATALASTTAHAQSSERAKAEVTCVPAGAELTYDCTIRLARAKGGAPLEGAQVSVGADMPSMPGMHSVRPVKAKPGGKPGAYSARVVLEMHGEWALKIGISGPLRDQVIHVMRFE